MVAIEECGAGCIVYGPTDRIHYLLKSSADKSSFKIDNKYFTISVKLLTIHEPNSTLDDTVSPDLPINAVIVNSVDFNILEVISKRDFFSQADVKLYIGPRPDSQQFQFCIENQIEVLDLDDEPERLLEALQSSVWPNAQMKLSSSQRSNPPTQRHNPPTVSGLSEMGDLRDQIDHLDALEDDVDADFGSILTLVNQVRAQGQNLSDSERRSNAEHVISAIYNMLGDSDDSD